MAVKLANAHPGTLVFCHSKGQIGFGIRLVQRIARDPQWETNHVAILDRQDPAGQWYVIQAEARGVTNDKRLDDITPGGYYVLLDPPPGVDVKGMLNFARNQVGTEYGFLTIVSILVTIYIPGHVVNVMLSDTWICSALAAECLRAGGWIHSWPDIYQVRPSQLQEAITAGAINSN